MARHESSRWRLSHGWLRGEDWWGDPVSNNFTRTDMLLHPWVKSMTETVPPEENIIGDMYIVAPGGMGDWEGHDNELAVVTENGWLFCKPLQKGLRIGSEAPAGWYFWKGDIYGWAPEGDVVEVPPAPQGTRYDVIMSVGYEAEPLEMMPLFTAPEDMRWPDGAPESNGRCMKAPTGVVEIDVWRNPTAPGVGEKIGIIRFITTSTQAEFIVEGTKEIPKGTLIAAQMPENLPDAFSVYSITLRFLLNN